MHQVKVHLDGDILYFHLADSGNLHSSEIPLAFGAPGLCSDLFIERYAMGSAGEDTEKQVLISVTVNIHKIFFFFLFGGGPLGSGAPGLCFDLSIGPCVIAYSRCVLYCK